MSQVTSQYGDSLVNGLLAGMKFRAQNEELKLARLQRAEWEAGAQHRSFMQELEGQLQQAQLGRMTTLEQLSQLEKQQAEFRLGEDKNNAPLVRKGLEANIDQSVAAADSSRASTDYTKELTKQSKAKAPFELSKAESEANKAKLDALASQFGTAQGLGAALGGVPTENDALQIAQTVFEIKQPIAQQVMSKVLLSGAAEKQKEIDATKAEKAQREAQTMAQIQQSAYNLALSGMGAVEGWGAVYGTQDPIYVISKTMLERGDMPGLKPTDPADIEIRKGLGQQIASLQEQITQNATEAATLRATKKPTKSSWFSSDSTDAENEAKQYDAKNEQLLNQLNLLQQQLSPKEQGKIINKGSSSKASDTAAQPMTSKGLISYYAAAGRALDPRADPKTIVLALKARGIVVDEETVKRAQRGE